MFYQATAFNRDLSRWCVSLITSTPTYFNTSSALTTPHLPVWGTCPVAYSPFITTWETTAPNQSITIPTNGAGYDFIIDWGDGSQPQGIIGTTPTVSHVYATAGNHQIKIKGAFPRIYLNNGGDKNKLKSVDQWGNIAWTSMEGAFYGATNLQILATDMPNLGGVTSMANMFRGATNLTGNLNGWNASTVTNMSYLFQGATNFNQPIGSWNVSNAQDMSYMFQNATNFNQNI
jgi:surface protein